MDQNMALFIQAKVDRIQTDSNLNWIRKVLRLHETSDLIHFSF